MAVMQNYGKWVGSYVYQSTLHKLLSMLFLCKCFLSNIPTLTENLGLVSWPCRWEQMGIKAPTFWLVGDLLYHQSYSQPQY